RGPRGCDGVRGGAAREPRAARRRAALHRPRAFPAVDRGGGPGCSLVAAPAPRLRVPEVRRARIGEPFRQRRRDLVLLGDDGRDRGPRDPERRVVPADAALAARTVLGPALVEDDRAFLEPEG